MTAWLKRPASPSRDTWGKPPRSITAGSRPRITGRWRATRSRCVRWPKAICARWWRSIGRITGRDRAAYFQRKLADALTESDVRVSLVAELDSVPVGFIMARVDLGEFGRVETTAVIDTIGVDPDYQNRGVGRALVSQLLVNLGTLRVEKVRTEVDWQDRDLLGYLDRSGFQPSQQLCFDQPLV